MRIEFYDTTLRDGAQAAGISYSLADKKQIFSLLSSIGIDLVEGGDPASNPKDAEFFSECVSPRLAAFGATCRKNTAADCDEGLNKLIATGAQTVCKMGQRTANIFVVFSQSAGKAFLQGAVFFQYIQDLRRHSLIWSVIEGQICRLFLRIFEFKVIIHIKILIFVLIFK